MHNRMRWAFTAWSPRTDIFQDPSRPPMNLLQTQEIPFDSDFPSTHLVHDRAGRSSPACSDQVDLVTTAGDTQLKHVLQTSSEGQQRGGTERRHVGGGRTTHWKECFHSWDPVTVQRSHAEWFSGEDRERPSRFPLSLGLLDVCLCRSLISTTLLYVCVG